MLGLLGLCAFPECSSCGPDNGVLPAACWWQMRIELTTLVSRLAGFADRVCSPPGAGDSMALTLRQRRNVTL